MGYKEKYNKLVEAIKVLQKTNPYDEGIQNWVKDNVPELRKSEDDKMREELIRLVKKSHEQGGYALHKWEADKMLDWLERQGQKPVNDTDEGIVEAVKDTSILDMVEPKFKVGDWVVWDNKISCHIDNIYQGKESLMYTITDVHNMTRSYSVKGFDNNAHLWTIQDAKDGDVLACESGWTCIFKTLVNDENFSSYCFMDDTKWFCETGSECHTLKEEFVKAYNGKIYPATKEQRDTLMKAMADAGWEFDFKQKELKKIEQKPSDKVETKFHEGDWVVVSTIKEDRVVQIASVEYLKDGCPSYITTDGRWFGNRTKARLLTNKDVEITTIPESRAIVNKIKSWSEEDKKIRETLIGYFKNYKTQEEIGIKTFFGIPTDDIIAWLEKQGQRPQITWKPNEKLINALKWVLQNIPYNTHKEEIYELLEQLRRRKENKV